MNGELLRKHDFDLGRIIDTHAGTTLGYGLEFRPVETLKPVIGSHSNFGKLEIVLSQGMPFEFLRDLDEQTKSLELETLLKRRNHQSAKALPEVVAALLAKDVTHGFATPIPIDLVSMIPGAAVQPLGIAEQWTTDAEGKRIRKFRNDTGPELFKPGKRERQNHVDQRTH